MKEEKIKKARKRILDFRGLFKNFISNSEKQLSDEEIILTDPNLTSDEKKEILGKMAYCNKVWDDITSEDNLKIVRNLNLYNKTNNKNMKIAVNKEIIEKNSDEEEISKN